jgi:mercuric ion transport protein
LTKASKDGFSVLGLGAAACVACCAGPILAFLGGLGIAGVASTLVIGAAGLLITAAAVTAIVVVRRGRTSCEVPDVGLVEVAIPTRRAPMT